MGLQTKEDGEGKQIPNPMETSNFCSRLLFCWLFPMMMKGSKVEFQKKDLPLVKTADQSRKLGDALEIEWDKEVSKQRSDKAFKPSLTRALARVFGLEFALYGIFVLFEEFFLRIMQPLFMGWFVSYFSPESDMELWQAVLYGLGVVTMSGFYTLTHHKYFFGVMHTGMRMRVASCSLIYRKALKLGKVALQQRTTGQMVNLLSNDVNRFDQVFFFFHYLWCAPLQFILVMYLTYMKIGFAALVGGTLLLVFAPLQGYFGRQFAWLRLQTAGKTDVRLRIMNEIIHGIKVIKMYAWEYSFANLVADARKSEIGVIQRACYWRAFNLAFFLCSSRLIMIFVFISFVYLSDSGTILTAEKAFSTLALFNVVKLSFTLFLPNGISQLNEAKTSVRRIQDFLMYDELLDASKSKFYIHENVSNPKEEGIYLENLRGRWTFDDPGGDTEDTLKGLTFNVTKRQLCAVIGPVGSGKGALLHALLGELPLVSGSIRISGRLSYATQEPWIFAGTVKQNILFNEEMKRERYLEVIKVCALEQDVRDWDEGDETIVGDRGLSLSGGQKARISLARAIYREAEIYLLDDPLSAVDANVSRHIFNQCIKEFLRDKSVVLVTHQLQYLLEADNILILKNGAIENQGTYDVLMKSGEDYLCFLEAEKPEDDEDIDSIVLKMSAHDSLSMNGRHSSLTSNVNGTSKDALNGSLKAPIAEFDDKEEMETLLKQVKVMPRSEKEKGFEETSRGGKVSSHVYLSYARAGANWILIVLLFLASVIAQGMHSLSDVWIAFWTNQDELQLKYYDELIYNSTISQENGDRLGSNNTLDDEKSYTQKIDDIYSTNQFYLMIYVILVLSMTTLVFTQTVSFYTVCMRASKRLHDKMFFNILRAKPRFFDINPTGPILNRFSKDMGQIDEQIPPTALDVQWIFLNMFGVMLTVIYVKPLIIIPTLGVSLIFYFIRNFYLASSRPVKRIEAISRSPIFSQLSSTLDGLTTIRASKAQDTLIEQFDKAQDCHSSAWFYFLSLTRWLAIYLDWVVVLYLFCCVMSFIILGTDTLGGEVGLAISACMSLTGGLQYGMRQSAEVENQMTSVERVTEYGRLESEADLTKTVVQDLITEEKQNKPSGMNKWPNQGVIEFKNVFLRYSEADSWILKGISFKTKPMEKIGIVGRTGAGKSSLVSALFRLVETEGDVQIDGVSIRSIGLHDLRKKISIIPQDPILFTGTLRSNLDPFDEYSDEQLWKALKEAHLDDMDLQNGLSTLLSEKGSNFSVGQRQLVCLARAILRNNSILVLDEATANVDPKTDSLIQTTIREKFSECTVLTIAHRLHTIMDSDRILVLHQGQVKEFGAAHELLQNVEGDLSQLVSHTGAATKARLQAVAKDFYLRRRKFTESES